MDGYNVLFIVTDDLNTELGCYGSEIVKSPSIDSLAAMGTRFSLTISQATVCRPSRISFLSGRRPDSTPVWSRGTPAPEAMKELEFLPEYFKRHGYAAIGLGKIFPNDVNDLMPWDHYERLRDYSDDAPDKVVYEKKKANVRILPRPTRNEDWQEPDGRIARKAVQHLELNRNERFFVAVGFRRPHVPRVMPKKYLDLYPLQEITLPKISPEEQGDWPAGRAPRVPGNFADMTAEKTALARQGYFAAISFMDAQVGYVLDGIERLGLADRTIVVFFSDHGYGIGEHRRYGKATQFMNVARVPLIISVPGKEPSVSSRPVELVSLYSTLAELCGLPQPVGTEGRSLVSLLDQPTHPWAKYAYTQSNTARSIISEEFRYTEHDGQGNRAELYRHKTDPDEFRNLVAEPEYAEILDEMRNQLRAGWDRGGLDIDDRPPLN